MRRSSTDAANCEAQSGQVARSVTCVRCAAGDSINSLVRTLVRIRGVVGYLERSRIREGRTASERREVGGRGFTHLRVASGYAARYGASLPDALVQRAAENAAGWARLCRLVSAAHAEVDGAAPVVSWPAKCRPLTICDGGHTPSATCRSASADPATGSPCAAGTESR